MSFGIKGFTPTSLTDWPGKISAVIFLPKCSFRCHYCYNPEFINNPDILPDIEDNKIFNYLEKKKNWLDGVVMLGGEPTIHPEFKKIVSKIKKIGLGVAVHTNGISPDVNKELIENGLVDYFAMDIKTAKDEYQKVVNTKQDMDKIQQSIDIIISSGIDYEFRTTAVPGLIDKEQILKIGKWLKGAKIYYLQQFKPGKTLNPEFSGRNTYLIPQLEELKKIAEPYFEKVLIRGV